MVDDYRLDKVLFKIKELMILMTSLQKMMLNLIEIIFLENALLAA